MHRSLAMSFRRLLFVAALLVASGAIARQTDFGEHFYLDSLHYVGLEHDIVRTEAGEPPRARLRSACGAEFEVDVGHHIGKDYGRVLRFDERELVIVELAPDGSGGWLEREQRLPMEADWRARPEQPRPQLPP